MASFATAKVFMLACKSLYADLHLVFFRLEHHVFPAFSCGGLDCGGFLNDGLQCKILRAEYVAHAGIDDHSNHRQIGHEQQCSNTLQNYISLLVTLRQRQNRLLVPDHLEHA